LLESKVLANLAVSAFLDLAQNRIRSNQEENKYDLELDNISDNLFPELNSKTWEIILLIVCSPYDPQEHMKSVIVRSWSIGRYSLRDFGFENVVFTHPESAEEKAKRILVIEEKIKEATQKSYEMALFIFHGFFTKEFLEKAISETKKLKFKDDSIEERKRKNLLETLEGLYQFLIR
jgi:hypothetical protein